MALAWSARRLAPLVGRSTGGLWTMRSLGPSAVRLGLFHAGRRNPSRLPGTWKPGWPCWVKYLNEVTTACSFPPFEQGPYFYSPGTGG